MLFPSRGKGRRDLRSRRRFLHVMDARQREPSASSRSPSADDRAMAAADCGSNGAKREFSSYRAVAVRQAHPGRVPRRDLLGARSRKVPGAQPDATRPDRRERQPGLVARTARRSPTSPSPATTYKLFARDVATGKPNGQLTTNTRRLDPVGYAVVAGQQADRLLTDKMNRLMVDRRRRSGVVSRLDVGKEGSDRRHSPVELRR